MTTRHSGYQIVLKDDVREDDAEWIINAIKMIKGVAEVHPIEANYEHVMARSRRDHEWADRLYDLIKEMGHM